jgi:hypothetical protein
MAPEDPTEIGLMTDAIKRPRTIPKQEQASAAFSHLDGPERARAVQFLHAARDDDWLTGLWRWDSDDAMTLYTVFEKTPYGYEVSHYCRRYPVTWWTARIEREDDRVKLWNYRISGDGLVLPDRPDQVLRHHEGRLISQDRERCYADAGFVEDPAELARLADCEFVTGEDHLRKRLARARRLRAVTEHYDLLAGGPRLGRAEPVRDLKEVRRVEADGVEFLLLRIELGRPSRSGPGGASVWRGYYWVHLARDAERGWRIEEEWLLAESQDHGGRSVQLVELPDGAYRFTVVDPDGGGAGQCYELEADLAGRPLGCGE